MITTEDFRYNHKKDLWAVGIILYQLLSGKHPFEIENECNYDNLIDCNYSLDGDTWDTRSNEVKDLLRNIFEKDLHKRISIQNALNHPWLTIRIKKHIELEFDKSEMKVLKKSNTIHSVGKQHENFISDCVFNTVETKQSYVKLIRLCEEYDTQNSKKIYILDFLNCLSEFYSNRNKAKEILNEYTSLNKCNQRYYD